MATFLNPGNFLKAAGLAGALAAAGLLAHARWQGAFVPRRTAAGKLGHKGEWVELMDRFLPAFHVTEVWQTDVDATPAQTYAALQHADILRSPIIHGLIRLYLAAEAAKRRRLGMTPFPALPATVGIRDLPGAGWIPLADVPDRGVVLGLAAPVEQGPGDPVAMPPEDFKGFEVPGFWKILWGFIGEPRGEGTLLTITTRTAATDRPSLLKFWVHWLLIGPFAGLLKRRALQLIKVDAEARKAIANWEPYRREAEPSHP